MAISRSTFFNQSSAWIVSCVAIVRTWVAHWVIRADARAEPAASPSFPKKVPYTLLAMVATFILTRPETTD